MILLLGDGEMTEKSSEYHHNLSKDRLLQNKLLEVDDKTLLESLKDVYRTKCRISSARHGKDSLCHEITGWIPPDITFRKTWKEKEKGKEGTKEFIHWRDARSKANHIDKYDNFVFSHYRDTKKYILQYREQHSNHDPSNSAAKKRLQSNNYIPPQQNNDVLPITSTNQRANNHSYNFQYTRRDSQKPAKCRSASSPSDSSTSATDTNTVTVSELDSHRERTRTIGSMSRNSRAEKSESSTFSVARVTVPTPVLVPHSNGGGKQSSSVNTGTQTPTMKGEGQQNGPRTLDTLACIADDKQSPLFEKKLEELTWREQLDVLRHIKPRTKSKRRKQRLYFFKENGEFEVQGTGDYFSVERYPEEVDPMNKEQVSQQRRIRHLVEQSKLKFARFSSLSGAPHTIDREFQNFSSVASSFTDLSTAGSFDAASLTDFQSVSSVSGEDAFAEDSQKQLNKSSLRTKYCPSLIWRLPKNQFSYATLSYPHRSQTCFHGDRRL